MNCTAIEAQLSRLLDGELEEPLQEAIEQHVSQCPACNKNLNKLRKIKALLFVTYSQKKLPTDFDEQFYEKIAGCKHEVLCCTGIRPKSVPVKRRKVKRRKKQ